MEQVELILKALKWKMHSIKTGKDIFDFIYKSQKPQLYFPIVIFRVISYTKHPKDCF